MALNDMFASVYELWNQAYYDNFSQILFENQLYAQIGLYTVGLVFLSVLLYYYVLGVATSKLNRKSHWAVWMLLTAAIAYLMMYIQVDELMISLGNPKYNVPSLIQLSLINAAFCSVLFFIISLVRKVARVTQYSNTPF